MPAIARTRKIDDLMDQASHALEDTEYFKAERLALAALQLARKGPDFDRMARILLPLQEARRQRMQLALETGEVVIFREPVTESMEIQPGCYLIQPPKVGADARRLRLRALELEVPVLVLCREPVTRLRQIPIVAISPGVTVRTRIDGPDDIEHPDLEWFTEALEALGDFAIATIDPGFPALKRLDAALLRLDAIPEHENLHQIAGDFCREAQREEAQPAK